MPASLSLVGCRGSRRREAAREGDADRQRGDGSRALGWYLGTNVDGWSSVRDCSGY